ncbi:MmgE/PrpD family protein [Acuticoccus sp. I52.16.1]|uniref:MmgE/PrpD family protein n=1 Tax=Acuticoccus sp. I52.16.1 TaxID=2928472 RepID=UPI001FCF7CB1|nr:MmgE/PrpD family protein [Acuticoccus sp. I52.16.1]UOM35008.1 MmgE/PrpD family protein [Acuticoccus sp. I52.16.1]
MSVTRELARYVVESRAEDIPADVRREARRAVVNIVGCMLGGAPEAGTGIAAGVFAPLSGPGTAGIVGRRERMDIARAALINGITSHYHDFDDTLPKNYIHASPPVAAALLAYASALPVSGADVLHAFILGFEVTSRIGNATYPAHYDAGWHSTGTCGVFGAAAAIGKLAGLSVDEMVGAFGLAATQASGIREMFGSMAKPFHAGHAARNGYESALLAKAGFTSGPRALEGPRGFAHVLAAARDLSKVTDRLGAAYDLRHNTYKPFPCGIVNHPAIDAAIQLHDEHAIDHAAIRAVRLEVAPLVIDLCGKTAISTGLEGKFSVVHGAAVGLVRGRAGLAEYTDDAVADPAVKRVRELAVRESDPAIGEDGVHLVVELADGTRLEKRLEHSLGNLERPLSDAQLSAKFTDQALRVLSTDAAERALAMAWTVDDLPNVADLVAATVPA